MYCNMTGRINKYLKHTHQPLLFSIHYRIKAGNAQGSATTMNNVEQSTSASTVSIRDRKEDRRNKDTNDKGYDTTTFSCIPFTSIFCITIFCI
jgi:hypothetical protein